MKILYVEWFTRGIQSFGIVVGAEDVTGKVKAYIGQCQLGGDEESDAQHIAMHGAKFLPQQADTLNEYLNGGGA